MLKVKPRYNKKSVSIRYVIHLFLFVLFLFHHDVHPSYLYASERLSLSESYYQALRCMGSQDYDEAIQILATIIHTTPRFYKAYVKIVECYGLKDETEKGLVFFQTLSETDPDNPYVYHGMGLIYKEREDYQKTIECYHRTIRLNPHYDIVYEDLIDAYYHMKNIEEGADFIKGLIQSNPKNAAAYFGMAHIFRKQSQWEKAQTYVDKAIALKPDMYQAYFLKGFIYQRRGQYELSVPYLDKGLDIANEKNDFEYSAKFLRAKCISFGRLGQYEKAFQFCRDALEAFQKIGNKSGTETVLGDFGMFYTEVGDLMNAMKYYDRAYTIACEIDQKKDQARHLNNIGIVSENMGQYHEALDCYDHALVIDKEIGNERGVGIRLGNMSVVYCRLNRYDHAAYYCNQALEVSRKLQDRRSETIHLANLGDIYLRQDNYSKALDFCQNAFNLSLEIGSSHLEGAILEVMGDIHRELENYSEAKDVYQQSLTLVNEIGDNRLKGYILNNLGNIDYRLGDYDSACQYYNQVLDLGHKTNEAQMVFEAYTGLANVYKRQQKYNQAIAYYQKAVERVEGIRNCLQIEQHKLSYFEGKIETFENLIDCFAFLKTSRADINTKEISFYYTEMAKARALLDIIWQGRTFHTLTEISDDFRQKFLINEKKLENQYTELSNELVKTEDVRNKDLIFSLDNEIKILQREKANLLEEIKEKYTGYYMLTNPRMLTVREVQEDVLDAQHVLINYFVGEEKLYVWILTKDSLDFKTIDLTREELETKLARISPLFIKEKENINVPVDHRWADIKPVLLNELYTVLLEEPAGKFIQEGTGLIIVPDDILFYFPFEILVTEIEDSRVRYLVESYPVSYTSSASLLNPELRKERMADRDFLAFGNPDFNNEQSKGIVDWVRSLINSNLVLRGNRFESLPNAEVEVKEIASQFSTPAVFVGQQATETCFKQRAENYRFIHLATHFLTSDQQPMYSKIIMSQTNDVLEDGYLQTYEIYNLDLNADLVVLSGCNTGLGKLTRGEGLVGMTRAFLYAGVPSIVVSLWPVEDVSTSILMAKFYQYLNAGLERNKALQNAKIDLIHSSDIKSNPFYWGPFILIGDWESVPIE